MAECVGEIFPVTSLHLEIQAYRLITGGVTAGQNTLKLTCAYGIEI
jgi:hypothetical protein